MKLYVTRWRCPNCKRHLELHTRPDMRNPEFEDNSVGPKCTECAIKLQRHVSGPWLPDVIVKFE